MRFSYWSALLLGQFFRIGDVSQIISLQELHLIKIFEGALPRIIFQWQQRQILVQEKLLL